MWESGESRPRDGDEVKEGVVLPLALHDHEARRRLDDPADLAG